MFLLPRLLSAGESDGGRLRMGLIADLHHGLAPDAMDRLDAFMAAVDERRPDAIVQLGDFNFATRESRPCTDLWEQFRGPRYHVLGNHDMDFVSKEDVVVAWGMPGRFYSFDLGGYHFVVLDRNNLKTEIGYTPYGRANFYVDASQRAFADPEQLEWLRADLKATRLPTIVFAHQGLGVRSDGVGGNGSAREIESIMADRSVLDGAPGVVACFCGHHHLDRYRFADGIHYVWINSASYYWVGDDYGRMAPYRDPLFTFVTFHGSGLIEVEGCRTGWEHPTPAERGYAEADRLTTYISERSLAVPRSGLPPDSR